METGLSSRPLQVSPSRPAAARPAGPHLLSGLEWLRGNTDPENSDRHYRNHPSMTKHNNEIFYL
jgi:hypothetical protein